jgi:hypothetical protein
MTTRAAPTRSASRAPSATYSPLPVAASGESTPSVSNDVIAVGPVPR